MPENQNDREFEELEKKNKIGGEGGVGEDRERQPNKIGEKRESVSGGGESGRESGVQGGSGGGESR